MAWPKWWGQSMILGDNISGPPSPAKLLSGLRSRFLPASVYRVSFVIAIELNICRHPRGRACASLFICLCVGSCI